MRRTERTRIAVVDCFADDLEALADFLNAPRPGTSLELLSLDATSTGDPAGGHLAVLQAELPCWEAAARVYGVRLVVTDAPVRIGPWDGDATVEATHADDVVIQIAI